MKSALAFLFAMAWTTTAAASASFPAEVDKHLNLSGASTIENAIAPPDGCLLCHKSEVGGVGTNNAFGGELKQHGAVAAEPTTVGPALDALEHDDPRAIDDIVMGHNPNDDPEIGMQARPQPEYGCSESGASAVSAAEWIALSLALIAVGRAHRRSQRSQ